MKLPTLLLVGTLSTLAAFGCAVSSGDESADDSASGSEDALTNSPEKTAQLDALRARVTKDFSNLDASKTKLVFVIRRLNSDATTAAVQAHIMKRDRATGKDAELSDADLRGSVYGQDIAEGLFDGPELTAVLKKANGKWAIATRLVDADGNAYDAGDASDAHAADGGDGGAGPTAQEAYVVGPTDVAYFTWDVDYGVKKSWLGL